MKRFILATLMTVAVPVAALADLSGTATLTIGQTLALDTGKTGTSGGDIQFSATGIGFEGTAKGSNVGPLGASAFAAITKAELQAFAALASAATIPTASLVVGDVFGVITNGGNSAAVLVTAVSANSISLQYTTFGASGTGGSGGPVVTGIVNNYSSIPTGFPNSGIAPGTIFILYGSGMSDAPVGNLVLQSSAGGGIPKTLAGASLSVTSGGTTVTPAMYYATPGQIAAVLPSSTPTGTAAITVTYKGVASNAFSFQVVPSALGLDTYFGTGGGLATATNATTGALFNYTNSVKPGETIVLWGSGLGADTADSDTVFTTTPHAVNTSLQIYFGGVPGKILYAGSSGYPGLDQIDVQVPSSVATGCNISVVAVTGSSSAPTASNFVSLPFNQGGGECTDTIFGRTGTSIGTLSGKSTVRSGDVFVGQITSTENGTSKTTNIGSAIFDSVTGASYGSSSGSVSIGGCVVSEVISTGGSTGTSTPLDAGTINLMGPTGTFPMMSISKGFYDAQLPDGAISSNGGTFVFNGGGGTDVGAFKATVNLPNPILAWTNQSAGATINRAQGVQVTWTGGGDGTLVFITGDSFNSTTGASGSFTCIANQSALQFTVPAYVTSTLPAGTGALSVENLTSYTTFTATGLDFGFGFGLTGTSISSTYQ